tara:strand:+ start:399 stop:632 length:234 start_codon:yes stop_codon:yes gene_type:complete
MKRIYKVRLSQYVKEYDEIYVEAKTVDDAALTAIEAMAWLELEWKRDRTSQPKGCVPIVVGPVYENILAEEVYKRKA